jgi:hypothetical protein
VASLQQLWAILDGHVKSRNSFKFVIPAKAGIQLNQAVLGSGLRGSDGFFDFLRAHHSWVFWNPFAFVKICSPHINLVEICL